MALGWGEQKRLWARLSSWHSRSQSPQQRTCTICTMSAASPYSRSSSSSSLSVRSTSLHDEELKSLEQKLQFLEVSRRQSLEQSERFAYELEAVISRQEGTCWLSGPAPQRPSKPRRSINSRLSPASSSPTTPSWASDLSYYTSSASTGSTPSRRRSRATGNRSRLSLGRHQRSPSLQDDLTC